MLTIPLASRSFRLNTLVFDVRSTANRGMLKTLTLAASPSSVQLEPCNSEFCTTEDS